MQITYEKASFIYIIFGVLEITKLFVKKVCPKYFHIDDVEYFEDTVYNELVFMAPNICENILRVKDFA